MNTSIESPGSNFPLLVSLDLPMNYRSMSPVQQMYRCVINVAGILANFIVTMVICHSRQLHYPRHVFWAAISVINQFAVIQSTLEIVSLVGGNKVTCQLFVLNAGVPYSITLSLLALAALDRYLAIARYEWYKNNVTARGTVYLLIVVCVVTYATMTSPFWTGSKNMKNCTVNLNHMHCVMIYSLLLGILCVTLHTMIFLRSRAAINEQPVHFQQSCIALQFLQYPSINAVPGKLV